MTVTSFLVGWYLIGAIAVVVLTFVDWYNGKGVVGDEIIMLSFFAIGGPFIFILACCFFIDAGWNSKFMRDFRNRCVIKGRNK